MDLRHVEKNEVTTVHTFLKFANVINALLLSTSGVLGFLDLVEFEFGAVMVGLYLILFGCLLTCFEVHLKRCDRYVFLNFGFMYYWKWRCIFFFFVGSMAFGMGIFGTIVGVGTMVNVFLNAYIMTKHEAYKQYLTGLNQKYMLGAQSAEAAKFDDDGGGFGQASHFIGVASGNEAVTLNDARAGAQFYKENKETVHQAAEFYGEHKEQCDKVAKSAYDNRETIKKAHDATGGFS